MALADLAAYKAAIASPYQSVPVTKTLTSGNALTLMSLWTAAQDAGSTPSTAVAPTSATTGALGQVDGGSSALVVSAIEAAAVATPAAQGMYASRMLILADRLSHQGGLDGTVTTAQTTNLPTAALTRYTSGDGVWAVVEVYTAVGSTVTTVTASYTNQAGTASQTTQAVAFGGVSSTAGAGPVRSVGLLPLASGDTGIRSVESVTLAASTTTAGNFGITLLKPLLLLPLGVNDPYQYDLVRGTLAGGLPEILDGACLFWLWGNYVSSAGSARVHSSVSFAEV